MDFSSLLCTLHRKKDKWNFLYQGTTGAILSLPSRQKLQQQEVGSASLWSWLLSERGEKMHRFKNHFSLAGSLTGRLQPCTCMQSSTNRGNLELLGCHTSCSLPPPKELTMEKHQEVVSLGTAKWKSVISPYRQYNENVETNLCRRREMNERLVCRTKSSVGNMKYFRLVFWLTLAAWSIRGTHVLV